MVLEAGMGTEQDYSVSLHCQSDDCDACTETLDPMSHHSRQRDLDLAVDKESGLLSPTALLLRQWRGSPCIGSNVPPDESHSLLERSHSSDSELARTTDVTKEHLKLGSSCTSLPYGQDFRRRIRQSVCSGPLFFVIAALLK